MTVIFCSKPIAALITVDALSLDFRISASGKIRRVNDIFAETECERTFL